MSLIKQYLAPTLIIILAGLAISFASWPLENTEWAEGIRSGGGDHEERGEGFGPGGEGREGRQPSGIAMVALPLVKVTILMGIGALFTSLIPWIARKLTRQKSVPQTSG